MYSAVTCLVTISTVTFSACGDGSDETVKVEEVIEAAAGSDRDHCVTLQTQTFTEQASHEPGGGAVARCEEEAEKDEGIGAVTASRVRVNGSKATAEATLEGGALNGQTIEVGLVKSGDRWKLNEIVGFAQFDEAKLIESLEFALLEGGNEVSPRFSSCFVHSFREGGDREIEELLLSPASEEVEGVSERCARSR